MGLANAGKNRHNNREVPTFEEAGTTPTTNTEVTPEVEVSTEVSTTDSTDDSLSVLRKALTEVPKPIKKKQHSIYLKDDTGKALDKFLKLNPNLNKSEVVNVLLDKFLGIKR